MEASELRTLYPTFSFNSYTYELEKEGLVVVYTYSLGDTYTFTHRLLFPEVDALMLNRLTPEETSQYLFAIGMAETLNYWKLTASPRIEIKAGALSKKQSAWWHDVLIQGMGEYFFTNNIAFTDPDFVTISAENAEVAITSDPQVPSAKDPRILIPVGGGKDSAVTLAVLGGAYPEKAAGFMVNPIPSARETLTVSPLQSAVTVQRTLDPQMIMLNGEGFLNGHVPISSVIAFISVFAARLHGFTHIAISNERSSNEGNTFFCDREINHQYSKTFHFETAFSEYCQTYLPSRTPVYFSFLRPLFELQIAQIFSKYPEYHPLFRSCNRGQKTNEWCGECPKCLFAFSLLVPFLGADKTSEYFGKNMYDDISLYPLAEELLGIGEKKPLECVGTHEETICAFYLGTKEYSSENMPNLLKKVQKEDLSKEFDLEKRSQEILSSWNDENLVPKPFVELLKKELHD